MTGNPKLSTLKTIACELDQMVLEEAVRQRFHHRIPNSKQRVQPSVPDNPGIPISASHFPAVPGIDIQVGLSTLCGDEERLPYWLRNFTVEAPNLLAQIRQSMSAGQAEQASLHAHTLKGRSTMLGIRRASSLSSSIEQAFEDHSVTDAMLENLHQEIETVCHEIRKIFGTPPENPAVLPSKPESPPAGPPPYARNIFVIERQAMNCC